MPPPALQSPSALGLRVWRWFAARGWRHWARVGVFIGIGLYVSHWLNGGKTLIQLRYDLHQIMTVWANPRPPAVQHTAVVLVEDDEYWRGELAGRRPIRRDYLARLLEKIADVHPAVIGLDFDLSAPDPASVEIPPGYVGETDTLMKAIDRVQTDRPVVLPRTVWTDSEGRYILDKDIHDRSGLCWEKPTPSRAWDEPRIGRVHCGYIALPFDVRLLPPPLVLANGLRLDSFARAAARAYRPNGRDPDEPMTLNYGSFIPADAFRAGQVRLSSREVMDDPAKRARLAHRIVLIGGNWSTLAHGRGPKVDGHASPAGVIPGVFVHANYVEAILDGRAYPRIPEWVAVAVEALIAFMAALVFDLAMRPWRKAATVLGLLVAFLIFSYVVFQNFGRFVDIAIPVILVLGHAVFEQVWHWREEAHQARAHPTAGLTPRGGLT
jgi:CHASE2 domain-containing sensor protein